MSILIPIVVTVAFLAIAIFGLYMMCTPDVCKHGVLIQYRCRWCDRDGS